MLTELFSEKRDPVPLKTIPVHLKKAIIAIEDKSFYTHSGVDLKGIARAALKDVRAGKFVEGASTITQQLAKTLFLTPEKNLVRKIKEAVLAFQMERRYTKDEILNLYGGVSEDKLDEIVKEIRKGNNRPVHENHFTEEGYKKIVRDGNSETEFLNKYMRRGRG